MLCNYFKNISEKCIFYRNICIIFVHNNNKDIIKTFNNYKSWKISHNQKINT